MGKYNFDLDAAEGAYGPTLCPTFPPWVHWALVVAPSALSADHASSSSSPLPIFPRAGSKARGTGLRVHFKHTREIMHTIKGMPLAEAKKFLGDVLV